MIGTENLREIIRTEIITAIKVIKDTKAHLSDYSLSAGSTKSIEIGPITERTGMIVTIKASYAADATKGVRVRLLYSPDGINYDSNEDADAAGNYFEPSFSPGTTRQRSEIAAYVSPYIKLAITNLDTVRPATVSLWTVMVK